MSEIQAPPVQPQLSNKAKLEAIETYLKWGASDYEEAIDVLNRIWFVVNEDKILPHDEKWSD